MTTANPLTIYIYALADPATSELRYIGKTNNLSKRYQDHCRAKGNTRKDKWVRSLHKRGLQPELVLIEEATEDTWVEAECFYIEYFRAIGCDLVNHTVGGEGALGYKHTAEALEKMSQVKLGKSLSEETKQALSKAMTGKPKNYRSGKAKTAIVTTPTGEEVTVLTSLRQYCLENGLNRSHMAAVARGTLKAHKGYTVRYLDAA